MSGIHFRMLMTLFWHRNFHFPFVSHRKPLLKLKSFQHRSAETAKGREVFLTSLLNVAMGALVLTTSVPRFSAALRLCVNNLPPEMLRLSI
jgi:hypothetical protein